MPRTFATGWVQSGQLDLTVDTATVFPLFGGSPSQGARLCVLACFAFAAGTAALLFALLLGAGRLLLIVEDAVATSCCLAAGTAARLFPLLLGAGRLLLIVEVAVLTAQFSFNTKKT